MIETKFKQTEIGLIPEDWEVKRLGDMCSIYRGGSPRPIESYITDDVNGINWIKIGDVASGSKYITKTEEKIRPDGALRSRKVYAGDFILSNSMSFGRPYILKIEGCIHDGWLAIQDYQNYFDLNYLYYLLGSEFVFEQYKKMAAGSSVQNLNKEKVSNVIVLIPEIYEQQRIATALSDVDALLSVLDKKIEKKKLIKQGAMQQLLTGKKRLQGFVGPWVEKKLGDMCSICRGGSPRPIESYITNDVNGINWIKIGDVAAGAKYIIKTEEKIRPDGALRSRKVYAGDFILSNSMSFGRPYILKIDGCIHDGWLSIQDYQDYFDLDYLYYLLGSEVVFEQYTKMAAGSGVQNLNKEKVSNVIVHIPQDTSEQTAIAEILSDMDKEIADLEAKRAKYEQIKQGMMQQLLTGKIRLIDK